LLSISSTGAAMEGDAETSTAVFVVRLSAPLRKVVKVRFATRPFVSGATQGVDYGPPLERSGSSRCNERSAS
jgi:hypothetical protein